MVPIIADCLFELVVHGESVKRFFMRAGNLGGGISSITNKVPERERVNTSGISLETISWEFKYDVCMYV